MNMTSAERERLAILLEEMGEVQQIIGKCLRHGFSSSHPDYDDVTNLTNLQKELGDVLCAISLMVAATDVDNLALESYRVQKLMRIKQYLHYQPKGLCERAAAAK